MKIDFNQLEWSGRFFDSNKIRFFNYSASGFCFVMKGKKAVADFFSDSSSFDDSTYGVIGIYISDGNDISQSAIPDEPSARFQLENQHNKITLFESAEEKTVCIRVLKLSEVPFGMAGLESLEIEGSLVKPVDSSKLKLEFIGDSITCGYGIDGVYCKDVFTTYQERADKSYAFLTAKNLNAKIQCCSWSGIGLISRYIDESADVPETSISMPLLWPYTDKSSYLKLNLEPAFWDEKRFSPDIVIVNLGTNDSSFVRDKEDRRILYVHQLRILLEQIHLRSPFAKICCCLGVMGQSLCNSVDEAVSLFQKDFKNVVCKTVKFPEQKDEDGIGTDWHPSAKTHQKIAGILTEELKSLL